MNNNKDLERKELITKLYLSLDLSIDNIDKALAVLDLLEPTNQELQIIAGKLNKVNIIAMAYIDNYTQK